MREAKMKTYAKRAYQIVAIFVMTAPLAACGSIQELIEWFLA